MWPGYTPRQTLHGISVVAVSRSMWGGHHHGYEQSTESCAALATTWPATIAGSGDAERAHHTRRAKRAKSAKRAKRAKRAQTDASGRGAQSRRAPQALGTCWSDPGVLRTDRVGSEPSHRRHLGCWRVARRVGHRCTIAAGRRWRLLPSQQRAIEQRGKQWQRIQLRLRQLLPASRLQLRRLLRLLRSRRPTG